MRSRSAKRNSSRREAGQVMVFFALLLPIVLGIGSVVVSVGNWYVHKKHLQTLVDAGAFAGGTAFNGCFQDPALANAQIKQAALEYSGDLARDPATRNQQLAEADDVQVVLNSAQYWSTSSGQDPDVPTPGSGYGHDVTLPPVDAFGVPTADGTSEPCSTRFLDVKATEDEAPLLFRWLVARPSPKSKARVEIRKVVTQVGVLPWAVPEADPVRVAVIVVNEDYPGGPGDPAAIRGSWFLTKQTTPPPGLGALNVWSGPSTSGVGINGSDNFSVITLISRDPAASLSGSLTSICNQNPVQTRCLAGGTLTSGVSFIHAYSESTPATLQDPQIRGVPLSGGCAADLSRPYFNVNGGCPIVIQAKVDFGLSGIDPQPFPNCAEVTASPGGALTWSDDGTPTGVWTGTFTPAADSGRNVVNLTARFRNPARSNCNNRNSKTFIRVAAPYVADDQSNSDPLQYITVEHLGSPANSMAKDSAAMLFATVGFNPTLQVSAKTDPPILLRFASRAGAQNQALDCDKGINFREEIINGCANPYSMNQRNGSCAGYGPGNLPQIPIAPIPGDDCIITEAGDKTGQLRQAMQTRFASPCTPNNWPKTATDPLPAVDDPRWVVLFIADETAFQLVDDGKGNKVKIYPVRKFAGFYVTAADGMGCTGDDPATVANRDVWGHFITYVIPDPNSIPSSQLCQFDVLGTCIALLVE